MLSRNPRGAAVEVASGPGLIKVRTTTFNQNNEPVQVSIGNLVVQRRPDQSPAANAR
jgi:hypothetical protein